MNPTAFCPLCRRWWTPTYYDQQTGITFFAVHNAATGRRMGRECDNSGQPVPECRRRPEGEAAR